MQPLDLCRLSGNQTTAIDVPLGELFAQPLDDRRTLAYQFHIPLNPEGHHRIGEQNLLPRRALLQYLPVRFLQKRQNRLHSAIPAHRFGQRCYLLHERLVLFGDPLGLPLRRLDPEQVFGVVPQQVGGDTGSLFDPLRHEEGPGSLSPPFSFTGIFNLDHLPFLIDFDDERKLFPFETKLGQAGVSIPALAFVVVTKRLQDHPLTSSLSQSGTSIVPFSIRARKKRGCGSDGSR